MTLSLAVWMVILSALVMANLPFVLDRPLAAWGWSATQGRGLSRWLRCLGFLAGIAVWSWGTLQLVGGAFAGGGNTAGLFFVKLLISVAIMVGWLYWPGARKVAPPAAIDTPSADAAPSAAALARQMAAQRVKASVKPFIDRLLEVLVGYVLVGTLGNALELNLGNAFTQGWEFYAVTLALFVVLGYPGFVWRYMLKQRGHH
ncbi:DUF2818 family protein [Castellaniella sp.]|uniref:DUF2818 family protein n=1 Tax=Castellaniella sp. TaxID=1955812 RepID=UPI0039C86AF5